MEVIVLLVCLISLVVSVSILCLLTFIIFKLLNKDEQIFQTISLPTSEEKGEKDSYTPNYADESKASISDFEPDHTKPVRVILKDEQGNSQEFITGEGEKMNPIETDDVFEEDENEK